MENLKGKTAIITGASRGIGAATARYFAQNGANVVLAARSADKIETLAKDLRKEGHAARAIPCDVADPDAVKALIEDAKDAFGSVDVLVNNAGIIDPISRIEDSDPSAWGKALDVNVKGVYHGLRYAIPVMTAQGGGTIINISSGAAHSTLEGWSHYAASKAAVLRLTGVANTENAADGIRVIGISPGTVATDMIKYITETGVNAVSKLPESAHIPADWVAKAIAVLCGPVGDDFLGTDFTLKTDEGRKLAGLPPL
ncbi:MAG: SDR family oxidoreductase [Pseudomonadota bacterium]|nr:SDR family oxidoreductase [Pseudomonadota bacterium]